MAKLEKGIVQVYTGDGKGKTTAALGLSLRALGAGLRVCFIQFIKGGFDTAELAMAPRLGHNFRLLRFAPKATQFSLGRSGPGPEDAEAARRAWQAAREAILSGQWDLVVLDEVNNALHAGLLNVDELLEVLQARPEGVEVVCTGRNAPRRLVEFADLVTEMRCVKHPYNSGLSARRGIEF